MCSVWFLAFVQFVMSSVPRIPEDGLVGVRMSADEYFALGETDERYELVDGVVIMSPAPTPLHQKLLQSLLRQLAAYEATQPGVQYFQDCNLQLARGTVYEADIIIYAPGRLTRIPQRLTQTPELIIEVLSPGSKAKDMTTKRQDYARFGVAEYVLIDQADASARHLRLTGSAYVESPVSDHRVVIESVPGLVFDMQPLRAMLRLAE